MDRITDIIFFSLSRYDDPISFVGFSLAKELAKHNRVFFIEQPFTLKDQLTGATPAVAKRKQYWKGGQHKYLNDPSFPEKLRYVVPPRMLPVNFLAPGKMYDLLSSWNNNRMYDLIRDLKKENQISSYIFINCFNPFYIERFPDDIKPAVNVYYSVDDISQVEYTRKHGARKEIEIIKHADVCFATGLELQRIKALINPKTYYLPNAGDFSLFSKAANEVLKKPVELSGSENRKVIGFTGSVEYRTDFDLLKKMVGYHKNKLFVVVGPVYANEVSEMGFDQMPNVIFTGARHISELPAYLQYMDVMIIPYRLSVLTKSIYPLKLNEYLGAGKPVVSTIFSDDIKGFSDVVYLAEDHAQFLEMIDMAIGEDSEERKRLRMQFASRNTWAARVEQFWTFLEKAGY
jgi:teichuronic acid biosynthesis glycosyltransferase TuaH